MLPELVVLVVCVRRVGFGGSSGVVAEAMVLLLLQLLHEGRHVLDVLVIVSVETAALHAAAAAPAIAAHCGGGKCHGRPHGAGGVVEPVAAGVERRSLLLLLLLRLVLQEDGPVPGGGLVGLGMEGKRQGARGGGTGGGRGRSGGPAAGHLSLEAHEVGDVLVRELSVAVAAVAVTATLLTPRTTCTAGAAAAASAADFATATAAAADPRHNKRVG